jgi:hypothetical protein
VETDSTCYIPRSRLICNEKDLSELPRASGDDDMRYMPLSRLICNKED